MRHALVRLWPAAAVLAALASTGGTGGTCGGGGGEDPADGNCTEAAQCEGIPHVACLGQWACTAGACQWHCDGPPATGCKTAADCEGGTHDLCVGEWACLEGGTCDWQCDQPPPPECVTAADCQKIDAAVACDGVWDCQGGACVWNCVGPPWECSSDEACPQGYACVNGACQAVQSDCRATGCSGEVCAAQEQESDCMWLDWYKCLDLTTCGRQADGSCAWDLTPAFLACRDGGGLPCASDADCAMDPAVCPDATYCAFRCVNGVCQDVQCVPSAEACNGLDDDCDGQVDEGCPVDKTCYTDQDCAPGQACDHTGYSEAPGCCVPLPDGSGCPADYPWCPGVCRGVPVPCTADDECGPGQTCVAGTCVTGGPACRVVQPGTHGACKAIVGWIFDGKSCVVEGGCGCDPDCDAVFPSQKACAAACGTAAACNRDGDCAKGEACVGGLCVPACLPAPETCNGVDDDCDGQVDEGCGTDRCAWDGECPAGQHCDDYLCGNGWCSGTCSANPDGTCVKDGDCRPGEACKKDVCPACVNCPCYGTCTGGQACVRVKANSHGDCEMALGVIYDGQQCRYESGCGCGDDCAWFFGDLPTCWKACNAWPPD